MNDEITKRSAQEYLATKMAEEGQTQETKLNREAAVTLAPTMWKKVASLVVAKCDEWNKVTGEKTMTCKDTIMGDLRISCAGRTQQMTVHYDSRKLVITIRNSARLEHETDVFLQMEGYSTGAGRDVHLVRNGLPVNIDMLIVGELRVLAGMKREAHG